MEQEKNVQTVVEGGPNSPVTYYPDYETDEIPAIADQIDPEYREYYLAGVAGQIVGSITIEP